MGPRNKNKPSHKIMTLPLEECLAKTCKNGNQRQAGRNVEEHCRIAGAIAMKLLEIFFFSIAHLFPENTHLLAKTHDVGKASPTFQFRIYAAINITLSLLADFESLKESAWGGHAGVGYASMYRFSDDIEAARVIGYHHGRKFADARPADCDAYGGPSWEKTRQRLLQKLVGDQSLPRIKSHYQRLLVEGLTVLADWLASGSLFDDPQKDWRPLIDQAIKNAGFIIPAIRQEIKFADLFASSTTNEDSEALIKEPNAIQQACLERIREPGVYVLEGPMGMGKTEAALAVAYNLLASGKARGIYFGLPTQLTSNKIYDRVNAFLRNICSDEASAILAHGASRLKKYLDQELGEEGAPGGSWFDGSKRGLLAPFAVGTLDQALFSVLHVRHAGLRALGLAGKVVILDEVHSYDAYTGELLDELVKRLRKWGCTVIILSATLTKERRRELHGKEENVATNAYPLLTLVPENGTVEFAAIAPPQEKRVNLRLEGDDAAAIEEALLRAEQGQQVLWIENTIAKAQKIYRLLGARAQPIGVEVGLLHSRYTPRDRETNENKWTAIYGKSSIHRNAAGRILVGTQVLEQSLDLDADFLVTRICPTDMLLQRMGRLWRHEKRKDRSESSRAPETWILTPPLEEILADPQKALSENGTSYVYSPYVLGRTLEVWHDRDQIRLPFDIRDLLEATYQEREDEPTEKMLHEKKLLVANRADMHRQALAGKSTANKILDDEAPGTRLGNQDELKLLLLRDADWVNGKLVCADGAACNLKDADTHAKRATISSILALNTLRIPKKGAPQPVRKEYLKKLAPFIFEARTPDEGGSWNADKLRIAFLEEGGRLRDVFGEFIDGLRYSSEIGYHIDD